MQQPRSTLFGARDGREPLSCLRTQQPVVEHPCGMVDAAPPL